MYLAVAPTSSLKKRNPCNSRRGKLQNTGAYANVILRVVGVPLYDDSCVETLNVVLYVAPPL